MRMAGGDFDGDLVHCSFDKALLSFVLQTHDRVQILEPNMPLWTYLQNDIDGRYVRLEKDLCVDDDVEYSDGTSKRIRLA